MRSLLDDLVEVFRRHGIKGEVNLQQGKVSSTQWIGKDSPDDMAVSIVIKPFALHPSERPKK